MLDIYVDADSCPVKKEVCKVALRYKLKVIFVSNTWMQIPTQIGTRLVVVAGNHDAADDWIVEHASKDDIVVTADIPLVDQCVKKEVRVLGPNGKIYSDANIGEVVATRDLHTQLRQGGMMTGGPAPFDKRSRSQFLQSLDQLIQQVKREMG